MTSSFSEHDLLLAAEEEGREIEAKQRRRLLILMVILMLSVLCLSATICRYVAQPMPLPELLPLPGLIDYRPHYLFSIYGVVQPVGIALSPDEDRMYVTESGGERLVKVFDLDGDPLGGFSPPNTAAGQRSPVYVDTDGSGRVYVTDRFHHVIYVYDPEGRLLDVILDPHLTLRRYLGAELGAVSDEANLAYNALETTIEVEEPGDAVLTVQIPELESWSPLGLDIDSSGRILVTDVTEEQMSVRELLVGALFATTAKSPDPLRITLGGADEGLAFPNDALRDSQGRIYISDGNNGRVSVWSDDGQNLFSFGLGSGPDALNLPRGTALDERGRLHVVDAVGQKVKVYQISEAEPKFLYAFGDMGLGDGQFNFPNDIVIDSTGRLYIADRENDRIQVWSY